MCLSYLVIAFLLVDRAYWGHGKQKCIENSIHISGTCQQSHNKGESNLHSKWAFGLERMGCPRGGAMASIWEIREGRLIPLFHFYEEAQCGSKMAGPHKSIVATYCPKEQAHLVLPTVSAYFLRALETGLSAASEAPPTGGTKGESGSSKQEGRCSTSKSPPFRSHVSNLDITLLYF